MKRVLLLGLFVILLSCFVMAGLSTDIDFNEADTIAIAMSIGDEVRISMFGDIHSVLLDEISGTGVKFKIAATLSNNSRVFPSYVTLDTIAKVDLIRDGHTDLNVALYSVDAEEGVAVLVFQKEAEDTEIPEDVGVVEGDEKSKSKTFYLTVIGVIVVILLLILVFRSKKKDSEENKEEEKKEVVEEKKEEKKEEKLE